jgi:hypothetical protein
MASGGIYNRSKGKEGDRGYAARDILEGEIMMIPVKCSL